MGMMYPEPDDLLPCLRDSAQGDPGAPTDVYRRLKFLALFLCGTERTGSGEIAGRVTSVLWLDERGEPRSLPVGKEGVVIGRDPACDLVLAGPRISRRHCVVRLRTEAIGGASGTEIEDLSSANGTAVNGKKLAAGARSLRDGDVIEVGGVALAVIIGEGCV